MSPRRVIEGVAGTAILIAIGAGVVALAFGGRWPWVRNVAADADDHATSPIVDANRPVRLTKQARANLGLVTKPLVAETFWKTTATPGMIVDRPAHSDRGVVAPATGVVVRVHHFPGDLVRPGDTLFTLRLLSESLHQAQSDLFKSSQEIQIVEAKRKRIADQSGTGVVPKEAVFELESQVRRLQVANLAHRQELLNRGLARAQIDGIAEGKFVSEIDVLAPPLHEHEPGGDPGENTYELQELKVDLGQQASAGQTLCLLSNHRLLAIEGRAFRQEASLIEKAAREGWAVTVEFMEEADAGWPTLEQSFTIANVGATVDPASRTFAFFVPLRNQTRTVERDGRRLVFWRYRPGQRVRLHVRTERIDDVFVLPAEAVVREGPDFFVFRQNGELFDRKPVHVVHLDRRHAVVANDGAVPASLYVAQNAAAQLNRALGSRDNALPPGFHMHADGSIHSNAAHK